MTIRERKKSCHSCNNNWEFIIAFTVHDQVRLAITEQTVEEGYEPTFTKDIF